MRCGVRWRLRRPTMATLNDIKDRVRKKAGRPTTTEYSDADLETCVTKDALDWLNQRRPARAIGNFETVADQQDYDEKPASAYGVEEVFWMSAGYDEFSPQYKFLPSSLQIDDRMAGFSTVDNPALMETYWKSVGQYIRNFGGRGEETDEGKIRLVPVPDDTGTVVYFIYTYPRWSAVTAVPEEYVEALIHKAASVVLRELSVSRGVIRGSRIFTGGGGANEKEASDSYLADAEAAVPEFDSPFSVG